MTIFISYARVDHKNIEPVLSKLREQGFELWIDEEGIEGASFWRKEIVEAIKRCSTIIFFATEASCQSDAVFKELALANEEKKPILPVLLKHIQIPSEVRYQIAGIQNINLTPNWDKGIQKIITSLSYITSNHKHSEIGKTKPIKINSNYNTYGVIFFFIMTTLISFAYIIKNDLTLHQEKSVDVNADNKEENIETQATRSIEQEKHDANQNISAPSSMAFKALVIGNDEYEHNARLDNPVNDAKDITDLLKTLGFEVTELINLKRNDLLNSIESHYISLSPTRTLSQGHSDFSLTRKTRNNNIVHLVYYAGHSAEIDGKQYIAPIDAEPHNSSQLISIQDISPSGYGINTNNNFTLYSTASGKKSIDGNRTNSPFAKALIEGLKKPDLDLFSVFTYVRQSVKSNSKGFQMPWIAASADQPLWLHNVNKNNIQGGVSIVILDGCRDNPFEKILRPR